MLKQELAPIALFVYKRLQHTKHTICALEKNTLALESDLFIFSDAPKKEEEFFAVSEVREYIKTISGFKSVHIVERDINWGLAKSIITGVTELCSEYGRVIVLEDDIMTSAKFLAFLNNSLSRYSNDPQVWHISGWNYPIEPKGLEEAFFWRIMNCWGWATWQDRWKYFEKNPEKLLNNGNRKKIRCFNLDDTHDFWAQVKANDSRKINTWAIFWYATIFEHNGLCLNPARSLAHNIGNDGTGENCGRNSFYDQLLLAIDVEQFPSDIQESKIATKRIKNFYNRMKVRRVSQRAFNIISRILHGIKIICLGGK